MDRSAHEERIRRILLTLPNRRAVYEAIVERPGAHLRALCRQLRLAMGSVEHHLRTLQQHGLVFSHSGRGKRSYFAAGQIGAELAGLLHAMMHPLRLRLVALLREHEELDVRSAARLLRVRRSAASFHLRSLLATQVLERVRVGRTSVYALRDAAAAEDALERIHPPPPSSQRSDAHAMTEPPRGPLVTVPRSPR